MRHVSDGMLRWLHDERTMAPLSARHHLMTCRRCQERYSLMAAEVQAIAVLFGVAPREEFRPCKCGTVHHLPRRDPDRAIYRPRRTGADAEGCG